jgi:hypothetical protein
LLLKSARELVNEQNLCWNFYKLDHGYSDVEHLLIQPARVGWTVNTTNCGIDGGGSGHA